MLCDSKSNFIELTLIRKKEQGKKEFSNGNFGEVEIFVYFCKRRLSQTKFVITI